MFSGPFWIPVAHRSGSGAPWAAHILVSEHPAECPFAVQMLPQHVRVSEHPVLRQLRPPPSSGEGGDAGDKASAAAAAATATASLYDHGDEDGEAGEAVAEAAALPPPDLLARWVAHHLHQVLISIFWAEPPGGEAPSVIELVMSVSVFTLNPKAVHHHHHQ